MIKVKMETPTMQHVPAEDFAKVYEPAEDSFLMIDALEGELNDIKNARPMICVEIGSGSGIVLTALAKALGDSAFYFATDINIEASKLTINTGRTNGVSIEATTMDLLTACLPRLAGIVDVLIFNPPYVVTPDEEVSSSGLSASWAGGKKGRKVMDRLFPFISQLLSPHGKCYLLIIQENDKDDIVSVMEKFNLKSKVVVQRRCGAEKLSVLRFNR